MSKIPDSFRDQYETLLQDRSYETREIALLALWNNFPLERFRYLNMSKNWIGFNDYNLRILWLALALTTPSYANDRQAIENELVNYASPNFESNIRQSAIEKLISFNMINDIVLKNLVNAATHHMWQFSKFGRDNLRTLLKNPERRTSLEQIVPTLNEAEQFQLIRLLKE